MFRANMKLYILIFICFLSLSNSLDHSLFLNEKTRPVNYDVIKAINLILENVFLTRYSTVNIITTVENPREPFFVKFKSTLLKGSKGFCIYRLDNHTRILNIRTRLKIYNVFLIDSIATFNVLINNITPDKFNFGGKYLFVPVYEKFEGLHRIFEAMWRKRILDVSAIVDDGEAVRVHTFFPFRDNNCGDLRPVIWSEFDADSGTFDKSWDDVFPNKLKNMHKCEVRLVTFDRCPASCVSKHGNEVKVSGFDIEIMEAIEENLNFTLNKTILLGEEQWGSILPNKSTTGAITKIVNNESDIAIGNYILRANRVAIMDASMVYYSFPVVFAIPLGEKYSAFQKMMRPYNVVVWICMLVMLSGGLLVIFVLNVRLQKLKNFVYGRGITKPVINMAIAVFGGSQRLLPQRNFARFLLMMFVLFCLVQRNVYQGLLYNYLKSDGRKKEVQSIDEMVAKGFDFYMYESYVDIIQSQPKIYDNRKIINEKDFVFNRPLGESVKSAFMTQMTDIIYRNQRTYKSFVLHVCKEELLTVNIVMYFPKNSYLRPAIDLKLIELQTAGLLEYWIAKSADSRFYNPKKEQRGPTKMEIEQFFGVFNLWFIGLGAAIILFIAELTGSTVKKALRNTQSGRRFMATPRVNVVQ